MGINIYNSGETWTCTREALVGSKSDGIPRMYTYNLKVESIPRKRVTFSDTLVLVHETYNGVEYDRSKVPVLNDFYRMLTAHREVQIFKRYEMIKTSTCECETKQLRQPLARIKNEEGQVSVNFLAATSYSPCTGECQYAIARRQEKKPTAVSSTPHLVSFSSSTALTI